jgi:hypothetical protein
LEPAKEPPPFVAVFDELAFFHLICPCGSASLRILGHPNPEIAGLCCPVLAQCAACGCTTPVFDHKEHGYEAELGEECCAMRGSGEPQRFSCTQCSGVTFAAYPAFSYQFEVDEFDARQAAHIQDFFDYFVLYARCEHCGTLNDLVEYEA